MDLEEKVNRLYELVEELKSKIANLEREEKWVSAKELALMMGCSQNNIYVRIRKGEIYASKKAGPPRIPLSQFYEKEEKLSKAEQDMRSAKERIFA